jgi:hypothetical protein
MYTLEQITRTNNDISKPTLISSAMLEIFFLLFRHHGDILVIIIIIDDNHDETIIGKTIEMLNFKVYFKSLEQMYLSSLHDFSELL